MKTYSFPDTLPDNKFWHLPATPIAGQAEDKLHHSVHARQLEYIIQEVLERLEVEQSNGDRERKNTISLLGDFGTGKSSIYSLLKENLDTDKLAIFRLSAWKHYGENLRIAFLRKVHLALYCQTKGWNDDNLNKEHVEEIDGDFEDKFYSKSTRRSTDTTATPVSKYLQGLTNGVTRFLIEILGITVLITLFIVAGIVGSSMISSTEWHWAVKFSPFFLALFPAGWAVNYLLKRLSSHLDIGLAPDVISSSAELPRSSEHLEAIFHRFVSDWRSNADERYPIFFIDDIDRQAQDQLVDALDAIRTFMETGECLFVIACDEKRVKHALASARGVELTDTEPGPTDFDDYVHKYFPHPYRLPPFQRLDLRELVRRVVRDEEKNHILGYLETDGFPLEDVTNILVHDSVASPRQAFRLVDEFCSQLRTAHEMEQTERLQLGTVTKNPWFLARMVVLRLDFPWMIERIAKNDQILDWLSTLAIRGKGRLDEHEKTACAEFFLAKDGSEQHHNDLESVDWDNQRWPELIRFVSLTATYRSHSARPFVHLNEQGELGGSAFAKEVLGLAVSNQAPQMRKLLQDSQTEKQRSYAAELIGDLFFSSHHGPNELNNVSQLIPHIIDDIPERCRAALANAWASHTAKLLDGEDSRHDFLFDDIEDYRALLHCLSFVTSDESLQGFPIANPEFPTDADLQTERARIALDHLDVIEKVGASARLRKLLHEPIADDANRRNSSEWSAVTNWAEWLNTNIARDDTYKRIFGRPFLKRFSTALSTPIVISKSSGASDAAEEDTADPSEKTERRSLTDQEAELLRRLLLGIWPALEVGERGATVKELLDNPSAEEALYPIWDKFFKDLTAKDAADVVEIVVEDAHNWSEFEKTYVALDTAIAALSSRGDLELQELAQVFDETFSKMISKGAAANKIYDRVQRLTDIGESFSSAKTWSALAATIASGVKASDNKNGPPVGIKNHLPFFFANHALFSSEDQQKVVFALMTPLESTTHHRFDEALEWRDKILSNVELRPFAAEMATTWIGKIGSGQDWGEVSQRVETSLQVADILKPDAISTFAQNLISILSGAPTQADSAAGSLRAVTALSEYCAHEDLVYISTNLLVIWQKLPDGIRPVAIEALAATRAGMPDEKIDTYRAHAEELLKAGQLEVWDSYSGEWPNFDTSHKLEVFSLLSDVSKDIRADLEKVVSHDDNSATDDIAKVVVLANRKLPAIAQIYVELLETRLHKKALAELAISVSRQVIKDWIPTDRALVPFLARYVNHPTPETDKIFLKLCGGDIDDMRIVCATLADYLPSNTRDRDSAFVEKCAQGIAAYLRPTTEKDDIRAVLKLVRSAKLGKLDVVAEARDQLKDLKQEDKDLWRELDKTIPKKSFVEKIM